MVEIEAKIRVGDLNAVRKKLTECGAEFIGDYTESNHILDRQGKSLRSVGCGLRVRTVETNRGQAAPATFTFKGPVEKSTVKRREEIEVEFLDAEKMLRILAAIGFDTLLSYTKRRESWSLEGCRIELDEVPLLGTFVEIEGPTEQAIDVVRNRLELSDQAHVVRGYVDMLANRCRELRRSMIGIDFVD